MYQQLVEKARERRKIALREARMPHRNIFWDGTPPTAERHHTVLAQMSDLRIRLGRTREPLIATFV
ncbi:MAG: hypothetical protein GW905_07505 [Rhodobacterales bacterium]|nr:hypothetical protein [Rhodobacterales bacterium]